MDSSIPQDRWVYIVVKNPDNRPEAVGVQDPDRQAAFVPVFLEKEDALRCQPAVAREPGSRYEVQAILFEDLARYASENDVSIYVLNGAGEVRERIVPALP